MKKRFFWILMIVMLITHSVSAEMLGELSGVLKPESIQVSGNELYVVEGGSFLVYSLTDLKLIRKFGKKGEGPGELKVFPFWMNALYPLKNSLYAEGFDKFIFFNKEGKAIREHQKKHRFFKLLPVGENFVGRTFPIPGEGNKRYTAVRVYNSKIELIKELYREPLDMLNKQGLFTMVPDAVNFTVYDDKIFLERSSQGFIIDVFDARGKLLYSIKKDTAKLIVTDAYKKQSLEELKINFSQKGGMVYVPIHVVEGGWEAFSKWADLEFPEYFPPIQDITVIDGKIYAQTYKVRDTEDDAEEYIVMDLKGNVLKKVFLPKIKNSAVFNYQMMGVGLRFYAIDGNRFVYIDENEDTEEWEVHVVKI